MTQAERHVTHGKDGPVYTGFKRMELAEYHAMLQERFGVDPLHWKVVCPSCGTVQSMQDFFDAAKAETPEEKDRVVKMVGFDCIGRLLGAGGAFNRERWKPCNYTSDGLFCVNTLIVVMPDGKCVPAFEPAEVGVWQQLPSLPNE